MKKITLFVLLTLLSVLTIDAQVVINGKTYCVDTIMQRQVGPGIMHMRVRLPEYPLNAYLLEIDMKNPYNRVETTQAKNLLGKTEKLADAYNRHKGAGKKPITGCNASFWCVSSQIPWYNFMPGVPHGAEVVNDTIYVNTNRNGVFDFNGGTVNTASTIISGDKVYVGRHEWYGCVKSPKFSQDQEIIQVNKCIDAGQLVLFNHARGRNNVFYSYVNDCHYIFLKLKEGSKWAIAKDIKFEVAEIKLSTNNQVLGNYDACLIADGAYKAEMEKLAVGDEVAINTYWFDIDGDKTPIAAENMTEGEAHVMLKGEITNRANGDYGAMVYSRTAYGCNADNSKFYMIVIDKSTHPVYGNSVGCTATVMCQLWKSLCPDLWNVANMDAGGSAQMMLDGEVINKTTEATPRAVANGMFAFSVAPAEDSDVVTSIRFEEPHHRVPVCYSYSPNVLGYNKYGELISENVPVTYTCSENLGKPNADGSAIDVGADVTLGTITAHYNGAEVTAPVYVETSEFAIRIKPMILIDATREYPIEITTEFGGKTLQYDPSRFTWEIGDESVVSIERGVLRGLKEGSTTIKAVLGDFTDETNVKVEIAKSPKVYQTWNDWTVTSANLSSDAVLSSDGVISFGYEGARKATINLAKDVMIYSLPDNLWLEFTTTTKLFPIVMDIRTGIISDENLVEYGGDGYEAGTYKVDLLAGLGDKDDIGIYPINIKSILFNLNAKGYTSGSNTITINGLWAEYNNSSSSLESLSKTGGEIKVFPNEGKLVVSASGIDKVQVDIYSMSGTLLYRKALNINGGNAVLEPNLPAGAYLVAATGGSEKAVNKMIIK